jgi:hypothetical protein
MMVMTLLTFVSSLLPLVCVSYLRFLCLFAHSGVQYILCCVFALFFVVLLLPVSLDCDFLIAPSQISQCHNISVERTMCERPYFIVSKKITLNDGYDIADDAYH